MIRLSLLEPGETIKFTSDLGRILGVDDRGWIDGEYEGDKPVNIITHKWLYIYLDQLSTSSNLVNGAPSTLLAIIPTAAEGIININPNSPIYKKLEVGHVHQLNICVLDEEGKEVKNRDKEGRVVKNRPITAVLEIRENA